MANRILVLGSFGNHNNQLDGQTIKTRQVYQLLKDRYDGEVDYFCTMRLRKEPYLIIRMLYKVFQSSTIVCMYASSGGLQTLVPQLYKLTKPLSKKLIYIAIGSGQADCMLGYGKYTQRRDDLIDIYRHFDGFLSETQKVKNELTEILGYTNVDLFPNFRYFDDNISFSPASKETLRLVFMARIIPEKGYDVACEFFDYIKGQDLDITLDFYGQIDDQCSIDFMSLMDKYASQGVRYKGVLRPGEIYSSLCKYDVILFPTRYGGEGIPGTVIDGYVASLPVIATNWQYAHEIIEDGVNGFIVSYDNPRRQQEFNESILRLYNDRELLNRMKYNAFETRVKYSPDVAWDVLTKYL